MPMKANMARITARPTPSVAGCIDCEKFARCMALAPTTMKMTNGINFNVVVAFTRRAPRATPPTLTSAIPPTTHTIVKTRTRVARDCGKKLAAMSARAAATPPQPVPLRQTHPEHMPLIHPTSIRHVQGTLVATPSDDVGRDLNTVSIDREMVQLATNTLHYNASAEILSRAFDQLKRTVSETQ